MFQGQSKFIEPESPQIPPKTHNLPPKSKVPISTEPVKADNVESPKVCQYSTSENSLPYYDSLSLITYQDPRLEPDFMIEAPLIEPIS